MEGKKIKGFQEEVFFGRRRTAAVGIGERWILAADWEDD